MIQMHLLSVSRQWMTFMRLLMTTTQTEKKKNDYVRDMIAGIMTNKKFQAIIK